MEKIDDVDMCLEESVSSCECVKQFWINWENSKILDKLTALNINDYSIAFYEYVTAIFDTLLSKLWIWKDCLHLIKGINRNLHPGNGRGSGHRRRLATGTTKLLGRSKF